MDALTAFGLFAVTAMLVCYALEDRSHWFILAFAGAALGAEAERRALFLRPRSRRSRIGLRPALFSGRRRDALLIVLDFRCVWLSAFSIVVARRSRLGAGAW
jgi:hypothetical protein